MTNPIEAILQERGKSHGNFDDNARISQKLKGIVRTEDRYCTLSPVQKEAIDMILHKISRVVAGNANFQDHWDDIAGYAKLVSERCHASKSPSQSSSAGKLHNPLQSGSDKAGNS